MDKDRNELLVHEWDVIEIGWRILSLDNIALFAISLYCQVSNASHGTYKGYQVYFGTQAMLGPPRLVKMDFGTQMALVLTRGELITLIAQGSSFTFLSAFKFELTILDLGMLPFGKSYLDVPWFAMCSKSSSWSWSWPHLLLLNEFSWFLQVSLKRCTNFFFCEHY